VKCEDSVGAWCNQMTPEDYEYYECQLELQQDLLKSYNIVERIIGINFITIQYVTDIITYIYIILESY